LLISLKSLPGIGFCLCAAVLLSLVLNNDEDVRLVAPLMCLFIVIATSLYWGRMAAILGGSVASLTFSIFFFPPLGSIRVSDPADRTTLILFELSVIGVSFLSPPRYPNTGE
jgi:K+-sensing histidine kinase KdpD